MKAKPGDIYRHAKYYVDERSGDKKPKFLLILAAPSGGDIVYRLLTSKDHARSRSPRCDHAGSYPGFYLGTGVCTTLPLETWVDLRERGDYDSIEFSKRCKADEIEQIHTLPSGVTRMASLCAANAPETSRRQSRRILDALT